MNAASRFISASFGADVARQSLGKAGAVLALGPHDVPVNNREVRDEQILVDGPAVDEVPHQFRQAEGDDVAAFHDARLVGVEAHAPVQFTLSMPMLIGLVLCAGAVGSLLSVMALVLCGVIR